MSKTAIIIHGHFYQPPRENPYTGVLPDQESAKPYINWNECVYDTCYKPNSVSRYLSPDGKIKKICNNYCNISSDFGPTLLNWIRDEHPDFMEKLLKAHKESVKKFGHSNFIAQSYNHTILPLDNSELRKIQIQWALEDYKETFGCTSEGFWCPECAINKDTIDDLANANVKFVILSPWQADENKKRVFCNKAYWIHGNKEKIAAFFYDGDLASGISFGHLLRDADTLYALLCKIKKERKNPSLIHWATDGEIYGHHEAFGDMALAALVEKINENEDFEITNYGKFLEDNPPEEDAFLKYGETGSSWSCIHGVDRWQKNCGCHTGGDDSWNQKWRTPLRKAFDFLCSETINLINNEKSSCPQLDTLIQNYVNVVSARISCKDFINGKIKSERAERIADILDILKNTMFSYTSCGWFFNDINGIEPRQNICYALCAAEKLEKLTGKDIKNELLKILKTAKSNLKTGGNGMTIALSEINTIPSSIQSAAFFHMERTLAGSSESNIIKNKGKYGFFRLKDIDKNTYIIENRLTGYTHYVSCSVINKENKLLTRLYETKHGKPQKVYEFGSEEISERTFRILTSAIDENIENIINSKELLNITENLENYLIVSSYDKDSKEKKIFSNKLGLCIKSLNRQILMKDEIPVEKKLKIISLLASYCKNNDSEEDRKLFLNTTAVQMKCYADTIFETGKISLSKTREISKFLDIVRSCGFYPDITAMQDAFLSVMENKKFNITKEETRQLALKLNFDI